MSAFYSAVARFYDAENADKTDDLYLYSRLALQYPGEILDVGCGSGRILIHLAQAGCKICGIDNSRAMLDLFEIKLERQPHLRQRIETIEADVRNCAFERDFSLILLSYNLLMHFLEQAEQIALLSQLRKWLSADGRLVIDLPNPGPIFASQDTDVVSLERKFLDPASGELIMLQSVSYLDRSTQILDIEWIYDAIDGDGVVRRRIVPHKLRYFFLPELRLLLERCGFGVDAVYGDTELGDYDAESPRMIVLARCRR